MESALLHCVSSLTELIGDAPLAQSPRKCADSNIRGVSIPSKDTKDQLAPVQAAIFAWMTFVSAEDNKNILHR